MNESFLEKFFTRRTRREIYILDECIISLLRYREGLLVEYSVDFDLILAINQILFRQMKIGQDHHDIQVKSKQKQASDKVPHPVFLSVILHVTSG